MRTGKLMKKSTKRNINSMQIDEICREWMAGKMMEEIRKRNSRNSASSDRVQSKENNVETDLSAKLNENYDFRFNVLTSQVEFRPRSLLSSGNSPSVDSLSDYSASDHSPSDYSVLDKRMLFTLCLEMRESGIRCWDKDIQRYIFSTRITEYHPVRSYFDNLPAWDGTPRVHTLISRVCGDKHGSITHRAMFRWFLAMTAQWMGHTTGYGNSLAPILVSSAQGLGKSTYCKNIVPDSLRAYYTDICDFGSKGRVEQRLIQNCLINLDEMDRFPAKKMPLLKNLMQVENVSICKAYQTYFSAQPRIASFICTSNRSDLLTDPSGSRRFICIRIHDVIDNAPLEHKQIYAELKYLLQNGERCWLTKEEEAELETNNRTFYREEPQMQLFRYYFRVPSSFTSGEWFKLTDIMRFLRSMNTEAMYGVSSEGMGKMLVAAGVEKEHRRDGSYYRLEMICGE